MLKRRECNDILKKLWCYKVITFATIAFIIVGIAGATYWWFQTKTFDDVCYECGALLLFVQILLWSSFSWRDTIRDIENRKSWGQWY